MIFATGKTGTIGRNLSAEIHGIALNLVDLFLVDNLPPFGKFDSLIHLAGVVGSKEVDSNLQLSYEVNVKGTIRLAEAFLSRSSGKFVFVSTSHVYGPSSNRLKEGAEVHPLSNYAAQKFEAEKSLLEIFRKEASRLCIVRVFSVLDWEVKPFTLGGGISKLADDNSDYVLNYCDDVRDFLTPRTIAGALEVITLDPMLTGVVNLCSGVGVTIGQAAETMLSTAGFKVPAHRIVHGVSEVPHIVGDNSKLTEAIPGLDLTWKPSFSG